MASSEGGPVSGDPAAGGREGGVHHDGVIGLLRREEVIKTLGIQRRRLESLQGEQLPPAWVDFVGIHVCSKQPGEDRDIARSGTWLQDRHSRAECGCLDDHQGLGRRGAELLKLNLRLVASGLEGQSRLLDEEFVDSRKHVVQINARAVEILSLIHI